MNLLRAGRIFVFEPPPGVKANMLRTFSSIPVSRMCKVRLCLLWMKGKCQNAFVRIVLQKSDKTSAYKIYECSFRSKVVAPSVDRTYAVLVAI